MDTLEEIDQLKRFQSWRSLSKSFLHRG